MAKKPSTAPAVDASELITDAAKSTRTAHPAFVFIGDAKGDGPDTIQAFGLTFKKNGDPTPVENAAAAKKLAGNSHFKAA